MRDHFGNKKGTWNFKLYLKQKTNEINVINYTVNLDLIIEKVLYEIIHSYTLRLQRTLICSYSKISSI